MCTQHREHRFGAVVGGKMVLNAAGEMIARWYNELENKFPDIECDEFQCMPNHIHFIVVNTGNYPVDSVNATVGATVDPVNATVGATVDPVNATVGATVDPVNATVGATVNPVNATVGATVNPVIATVGADLRVCPNPYAPSNPGSPADSNSRPDPVDRPGICGQTDENMQSGLGVDCGGGGCFAGGWKGQTHRSAPSTGNNTTTGNNPTKTDGGIFGEHRGSALYGVVQWFKTMTTNEYIRGVKQNGWPRFDRKLLQRGYWEHIVRNESELNRIRQYILNNPAKWQADSLSAADNGTIGMQEPPGPYGREDWMV